MLDRPHVDLRSDTVTKPTPDMRRAMAAADVGDDVFGEDPTAIRLEELAAERLGTEAALFVPTGTMGNQIALHVHCPAGREVVVETRSHILDYEMAAMASLSGLLPRVVTPSDGTPTPDSIEAALRADDGIHAPTGLVCLENTHNMAGGRVMPLATVRGIQRAVRRHGIPLHLDGARIFNAAVALGVTAPEVAAGFDSVMFCLSKGLGAPVGSMLCGPAPFVARARKVRKMFGGGMRQVGVLAAAGIVALEQMTERIADDHAVARDLAEGLSRVEGIELLAPPDTNIVIFRVLPSWFRKPPASGETVACFLEHLRAKGILALSVGPGLVRMVTHHDLPTDAVERTLQATRDRDQ